MFADTDRHLSREYPDTVPVLPSPDRHGTVVSVSGQKRISENTLVGPGPIQ